MKQLNRLFTLVFIFGLTAGWAQTTLENTNQNRFRQLYQELPTPNVYRTASGAPGHEYYQQKADYKMDIVLDDVNQRIYGEEEITYHNESPDALEYLWVQLDQNMRAQGSDRQKITQMKLDDSVSFSALSKLHNDFDGGFKLDYIKDARGKDMEVAVNGTMMRVNMETPLASGASVTFKIKWWYNINDRMEIGGRSGYEFFEEDGNYLYTIAQFFPRMAVYNEVEGWQNKQFLGRGEFTLPFGDYVVNLTVPADHVVAATGTLQNASNVLSSGERKAFSEAKTADRPVVIVSQETADERIENPETEKTKTWTFKALNVRDFGFASSRRFIWDAMGVQFGDRTVMAMSYYPKEGNPLWEKYSTEIVAHTLRVYSKYTFDYPYPVAISVHSNRIGMEYPMICFNGGRPEADGTYTERTKYGMLGVIIHEVGHNFFPMIVNSDERQWTWMDEGLNTFVQYLTEQEWEPGYPSRRGPAYKITDYMKGNKDYISPIMTNSESIHQFGPNAYGKPATGLNILRETILGPELFDYAFKTYSQRWMFKHPTPADFFRTMEDASGTDLDWFWRAWFYTNDHVDLAIKDFKWYQINSQNPEIEAAAAREAESKAPQFIGDLRYDTVPKVTDSRPDLLDFYNEYDPLEPTRLDDEEYQTYLSKLDDEEKALLESGLNYYQVDFEMIGGVPMPIILRMDYADGTSERIYIPAEIWKMDEPVVSKVFYSEKEVSGIVLDPGLETADTDRGNNYWPPRPEPTRFELYKKKKRASENPMQRMKRAEEGQ
jgi:hypothetical protein